VWPVNAAPALRIVVLAYREPGEAAPDAVVVQVAEALKGVGHEAIVVTIRNDVAAMVEELRT
jgi:hypothetical protein